MSSTTPADLPYPGQPATPAPYPAPPVGYGQPAFVLPPLASWIRRVGAYLLDELVAFVPYLLFLVLALQNSEPVVDAYGRTTTEPTALGFFFLLLMVVSLVVAWVVNRGVLQGRSGQSVGKRLLGLRLVDQVTLQPLGVGRALLRDVAHLLDGWSLYIGYLWPLWDDRKQTFADKVVSTVVVREP